MSNVAAQAQVAEKVQYVLVEEFGLAEAQMTNETRFEEDLGFDSLDHVNLVMACEREFDLDIRDEDAAKLRTVGALIALIQRRV